MKKLLFSFLFILGVVNGAWAYTCLATYYYNSTCGENGNGTASTCAAGPGATGAYNTFGATIASTAGDCRYFSYGSDFSSASVEFTGNGTATYPIVIDAYGTASAGDPVLGGWKLQARSYYEINNISSKSGTTHKRACWIRAGSHHINLWRPTCDGEDDITTLNPSVKPMYIDDSYNLYIYNPIVRNGPQQYYATWAPGTLYSGTHPEDVVLVDLTADGSDPDAYECIVDHTSAATWALDSSNWQRITDYGGGLIITGSSHDIELASPYAYDNAETNIQTGDIGHTDFQYNIEIYDAWIYNTKRRFLNFKHGEPWKESWAELPNSLNLGWTTTHSKVYRSLIQDSYVGISLDSFTNYNEIFNNVILNCALSLQSLANSYGNNSYNSYYNNTVISSVPGAYGISVNDGDCSDGRIFEALKIKNNLVLMSGSSARVLFYRICAEDRTIDIDYNGYQESDTTYNYLYTYEGSTSYYNSADWKTNSGQDSHSIFKTSAQYTGVNASSFQLNYNSPFVGVGTTSLCAETDYFQHRRNVSGSLGTCDIGAVTSFKAHIRDAILNNATF